ncbi:MAG: hypothetical protein J3Q66DRAFT_405260 [Benniella sp.]|nr:MAG: hypothetical protein J3Q66DRAFT_405260 [Benniella sp.]
MYNTNVAAALQANVISDLNPAPLPLLDSSNDAQICLPAIFTQTPVQGYQHSHQSPPLTSDVLVLSVSVLQQQVEQQQQQLVQQQMQLAQQQQQILSMKQQQQHIVILQSPQSSQLQTPPQHLNLSNDDLQLIQLGFGEPSEPQDVKDHIWHRALHQIADLPPTSESSRCPLSETPPLFIQSDYNLEELGVQRGSSPNNQDSVLVSHECNRDENEELLPIEDEPHIQTRARRARKPLQLQRKLEVIAYWEASEDKSIAVLCRIFKIPRSTVYGIINDREKYKKLVGLQLHSGSILDRYHLDVKNQRSLMSYALCLTHALSIRDIGPSLETATPYQVFQNMPSEQGLDIGYRVFELWVQVAMKLTKRNDVVLN